MPKDGAASGSGTPKGTSCFTKSKPSGAGSIWKGGARRRADDVFLKKERRSKASFAPTWRSGWDSNSRAGFEPAYRISSLVRTWHFRVCRGRWRQFWKRRKPLCCNGFRTRRPVLTSSISEKTRVQIEMRNAQKRSIFLRAGKKTRKKKTLVRYGFATALRI